MTLIDICWSFSFYNAQNRSKREKKIEGTKSGEMPSSAENTVTGSDQNTRIKAVGYSPNERNRFNEEDEEKSVTLNGKFFGYCGPET